MRNGAAIGYALLALKQAGIKMDEIQRNRFVSAMYMEMDITTEEEAEEALKRS